MKGDDLEQRLGRQAWREVPTAWRPEILAAAQAAAAAERPSCFDLLRRLREWGLSLLWPSPRAWAGVAALWLLVAAANWLVNLQSPAPHVALPAADSPLQDSLHRRQQIIAELLNAAEPPPADAKGQTAPRGEGRASQRWG